MSGKSVVNKSSIGDADFQPALGTTAEEYTLKGND